MFRCGCLFCLSKCKLPAKKVAYTSILRVDIERQISVQVIGESEFQIDRVMSLFSDGKAQHQEIYTALKYMLQEFYKIHSGPMLEPEIRAENGPPETHPSPEGKMTPHWAKESAELVRVASTKGTKLGRSNSSGSKPTGSNSTGGKGQRVPVQRRKSNLSKTLKRKNCKDDSGSEEEDDAEATYIPKKATRSRRRLETDLGWFSQLLRKSSGIFVHWY